MMPFFTNTDEKKVTGIIIVLRDGKPAGKKYSHIDNSNAGISTFLKFAKRQFPEAGYVNFYGKRKGFFLDRIYLE